MSIIHEAMKKSGQDKQLFASNPNPLPNKILIPEVQNKKQKVNWGPLFVLLVLVLITGPLVAPLFSSPYRTTDSTLLVPSYQETLATAPIKQFAIEEMPALPPPAVAPKEALIAEALESRPNFAINGIVYASPESYCLINGRVVKVGEKIDGATLESVTPDKATLNYQGTRIDLWVNHG